MPELLVKGRKDVLAELLAESIAEQPTVSPVADRIENEGATPASDAQPSVSAPSQLSGGGSVSLPPAVSLVGIQNESESFDPEVHVTGPDGLPIRNSDGTYRKKPGRKKGSKNAASSVGSNGASIPDTDNERIQRAHAAAVTTVQTLFLLGRILGGEEFTPIIDAQSGVNEPKMLTDAWAQYYITANIDAIPPWVGVALATGSYFLSRTAMPKTQGKLRRLWNWITGKEGEHKPDVVASQTVED